MSKVSLLEAQWKKFFDGLEQPAFDAVADIAEEIERLKIIMKEEEISASIKGQWLNQGIAYLIEVKSLNAQSTMLLTPIETRNVQLLTVCNSGDDKAARSLRDYHLSEEDRSLLDIASGVCDAIMAGIPQSDKEKFWTIIYPVSPYDLPNEVVTEKFDDSNGNSIAAFFDTSTNPRSKKPKFSEEHQEDMGRWEAHLRAQHLRERTIS